MACMRYRRAGAGPTVVLLRGSASSLHGVEAVARRLQSDFDVISLDLPGFGETGPRPDRDYRTQTAGTVPRCCSGAHVRSGRKLVEWERRSGCPWTGLGVCVDQRDRLPRQDTVGRDGVGAQSRGRTTAMPIDAQASGRTRPAPGRRPQLDDRRQGDDRSNRSIVESSRQPRSIPRLRQHGSVQPECDNPQISVAPWCCEAPRSTGPALRSRHRRRCQKIHCDGGHLLPEEDPQWVAKAVRDFIHTLRLDGQNT
ncbi:alpha/beta fold hydrolase [Nocardia sp. NPDC055002]